MKLSEDISSCPANFQQWCCYSIQKLSSHMFCNCKCSHISFIQFVLKINYDSQLQRSEYGAALTEGFWPQGPLDKMYHSVVSWIIEQQNCNFRDQCSMPILFPGSKWAADYTHLLCFQITVWLIVWFKIISKDWKINENRTLDKN